MGKLFNGALTLATLQADARRRRAEFKAGWGNPLIFGEKSGSVRAHIEMFRQQRANLTIQPENPLAAGADLPSNPQVQTHCKA